MLTSYDKRLEPLLLPRARLDQRWPALTEALRSCLAVGIGDLSVESEDVQDEIAAGIVGRSCERIPRERGGDTWVVPFADLSRGLKAWLGYRESWQFDSKKKRYFFRDASLTVFFGFLGDPLKPQVFRSEWAGYAVWPGSGLGFQAAGAGHPHWQFDVNESLSHSPGDDVASFGDTTEEIEEFEPSVAAVDVRAMVRSACFGRMHFASAAPWWIQAGAEPLHTHTPLDEASVTRWVLGSIRYMRQELARCEIPH